MKFTDGIWLVKEGFEIQNPKEVFDYELKADSLKIHAPFKKIKTRGDTLNLGLMTTEIHSPREDVMTIRLTHHDGSTPKSPAFPVEDEHVALKSSETDGDITVSSGDLRVVINKENYALTFYGKDQFLTKSDVNGQGYITSSSQNYIRERLDLGVGENIYGLGERFTNFVKNGQTVDIWNKDGGTSSDQSYKNVPFFVSNKGYGVFVNHPENVSFEVGSEHVSKNQFSVAGERLEYILIYGPSMEEILRKYTDLMGKPALPPAWSFGLWLSTSFCTDYNEETVNSFIDGMKDRDIPLDVFHFDCFWMKDFEWCNFEWDKRVFPEPEKMLAKLKAKGLKICVWINPYIAQKSALFAEGKEHGYFIKNRDGSVWQWDLWQGGQAIVDFTNPDACAWYRTKLSALIDMGVDSFKTDFGERIPTDVQYFDGSDPEKMHNYYAYQYNEVVFDLLKEKKGEQEAVLFARSATAGSQKFPVHWGGDCLSTYSSMAESLRGGLSFMLSGFSFWSHDIGGFEEGATPDIYKRWTQFGLLSSHSRYHGNVEYRVPWIFDEEAVDVTRKFTKLKMRLMPYLFKQAVTAHKEGVPVMRPMVLAYTEDPVAATLDRQYMLGENLLVAPIFNDQGQAEFYLPKGKWTNILTEQVYDGGQWVSEHHDYMSLPLLAKENSIIVHGAEENHAEYDYAKNPTIHIYGFENDGSEANTIIYQATGQQKATIQVQNKNNEVTVQTEGLAEYTIIWHKQHNPATKTYETTEKTIKLS
ncbi:alpha-xylosidase [Listeria booriae]|uniref:alpha-xylosidase n=1 Tax=Listeria booriae TaxID=1552123 RepID=UPI001629A946|nr:alpha-xylosidase [Listeria booriae]MBC1512339.1 alpha-xylosidase [Listeria booriae]MBC6152697.1 alpha-xylosidase [Listeria booriae]MBC6305383.1 alpha-xylosidase [Listeria booriae]